MCVRVRAGSASNVNFNKDGLVDGNQFLTHEPGGGEDLELIQLTSSSP